MLILQCPHQSCRPTTNFLNITSKIDITNVQKNIKLYTPVPQMCGNFPFVVGINKYFSFFHMSYHNETLVLCSLRYRVAFIHISWLDLINVFCLPSMLWMHRTRHTGKRTHFFVCTVPEVYASTYYNNARSFCVQSDLNAKVANVIHKTTGAAVFYNIIWSVLAL